MAAIYSVCSSFHTFKPLDFITNTWTTSHFSTNTFSCRIRATFCLTSTKYRRFKAPAVLWVDQTKVKARIWVRLRDWTRTLEVLGLPWNRSEPSDGFCWVGAAETAALQQNRTVSGQPFAQFQLWRDGSFELRSSDDSYFI